MNSNSLSAIEARARRAAVRVGYVARKSRSRVGSLENAGGFMVVEPATGIPVAGFQYDMEPDAVIEWCAETD
jgi:hypothetical protein